MSCGGTGRAVKYIRRRASMASRSACHGAISHHGRPVRCGRAIATAASVTVRRSAPNMTALSGERSRALLSASRERSCRVLQRAATPSTAPAKRPSARARTSGASAAAAGSSLGNMVDASPPRRPSARQAAQVARRAVGCRCAKSASSASSQRQPAMRTACPHAAQLLRHSRSSASPTEARSSAAAAS